MESENLLEMKMVPSTIVLGGTRDWKVERDDFNVIDWKGESPALHNCLKYKMNKCVVFQTISKTLSLYLYYEMKIWRLEWFGAIHIGILYKLIITDKPPRAQAKPSGDAIIMQHNWVMSLFDYHWLLPRG